MLKKKEKLFLFTSGFPFGHGESFLENELPFLAKSFKQIVIFAKLPTNLENVRNVPVNCKVVPLYFEKKRVWHLFEIASFKLIFHLILLFFQKSALGKLRVALDQLLLSYNTKKVLEKYTDKQAHQVIYSYWLDESALSFAHIKDDYPNTLFIARAHGWDVYFERHPLHYLPLRPYLSEKLDSIFFIAQNGLEYFKKIPRVYKGVAQLSYLGTINTQTQNNSYVNTERLLLLTCSSIIPLKRVHLLIAALKLLEVPFHWYHIGSGPLENEIHDLAKNSLAPKQYSFLGQLTNKKVKEFYLDHQIDLFLNTSSTEGIPVSMMEALSFGVPCMGTNVGGVGEIILPNFNGYLLSADPEPTEIKEALIKYQQLAESEKLALRKNAYAFWNEHFNAEKNYTRFIEKLLK